MTRSIHENTSWDAARFEVAGHRWVHVGEPAGVAVANDATYGHEVRRVARQGGGMAVVMRATLLRGPRFPDPEADQGRHAFRFHLVPAATVAHAVAAGYALNLPPVERSGAREVEPLVSLDGAGVIESVKLAEDRSGDVVVRVYEPLGVPGTATLRASFPVRAMVLTDLLERTTGETGPDLRLRPFQIRTVRITPA
jgi:alpha-mannosidase